MNNFLLPQKFFAVIEAMPAKLGFKVFTAAANYIYTNGEDKSINEIYSPLCQEFIAEFKAWADKRFAAAERARQRRLEAKAKKEAEKQKQAEAVANVQIPNSAKSNFAVEPVVENLKRPIFLPDIYTFERMRKFLRARMPLEDIETIKAINDLTDRQTLELFLYCKCREIREDMKPFIIQQFFEDGRTIFVPDSEPYVA